MTVPSTESSTNLASTTHIYIPQFSENHLKAQEHFFIVLINGTMIVILDKVDTFMSSHSVQLIM